MICKFELMERFKSSFTEQEIILIIDFALLSLTMSNQLASQTIFKS
ncbi:hypothetical protein Patl1_20908 [Pistacia atlantica]|uniref:Uncharacterized protein n=1 Tax=Pistacia atlantica TaxID=434234 RepID=A0ACC1BJT5_9ROSI|nr:hypothetical protein Patl1_20908 [Pistacia atlantica]